MLIGTFMDLDRRIGSALDYAREQATTGPSRELSLVITKLQEARLWMTEITVDE